MKCVRRTFLDTSKKEGEKRFFEASAGCPFPLAMHGWPRIMIQWSNISASLKRNPAPPRHFVLRQGAVTASQPGYIMAWQRLQATLFHSPREQEGNAGPRRARPSTTGTNDISVPFNHSKGRCGSSCFGNSSMQDWSELFLLFLPWWGRGFWDWHWVTKPQNSGGAAIT